MSNKTPFSKKFLPRFSKPSLQSLAPAVTVMVAASLIIALRAQASSNLFTGCLSTTGKSAMYNAQLGTSPSAACKSGDPQVSADNGDIPAVIAGTGLSGGASEGDATLSIANGGVGTAQLANAAVTVAKISSGTATSGQVLTADGSGGASWQTPSGGGGGSSNQPPVILFVGSGFGGPDFKDRFKGKNLSNAYFQSFGISDTDASNAIFDNASFIITTNREIDAVNFSGASFKNATFFSFINSNTFVNADFTGATFTDQENQSSVLESNDFTNANFTNANLNGTNWSGNTLTGITWSNTICSDGTNSDSDGGTCVGHLNGQ